MNQDKKTMNREFRPIMDVNVVNTNDAPRFAVSPDKGSEAKRIQLHPDDSNLMTIGEVAQMLRCSIRHVANLRRKGYLKFFRHGRRMVRIPRASVERYIQEWSTQVTLSD